MSTETMALTLENVEKVLDELRPFLDPEGLPDLEDERGRGFFLLAQSVESLTVEQSPTGDGLTFRAERLYDAESGT